MTKTIQTARTIQTAAFAVMLTATAHAAPGLMMSDRAESTGILIVGKAAPVERAGLMLSDRAGLLISDRAGMLVSDRAGLLVSDRAGLLISDRAERAGMLMSD